MNAEIRGHKTQLNIEDALQRLIGAGAHSITLFEHGSLQVKMYVPRGPNGEMIDPQEPHARDEIYMVARGSGVFFNGETRQAFQTGDLIFAPARSAHRFEDFTDDFAVWVMFFGPEGGEPLA